MSPVPELVFVTGKVEHEGNVRTSEYRTNECDDS